jgi:tetratricopeptide (TPR) repeat protein
MTKRRRSARVADAAAGPDRSAWRAPSVWITLIGILACVAVVYLPSLDNGFVNWDDPTYVTENVDLRDVAQRGYGPPIHRVVQGNYHPLTMLTLAWDLGRALRIDPRLGPAAARPFHRTSLLLHLGNTVLVFALAWILSRGRLLVAAVCAWFFAVHPTHVESVAWISARKDVLYALSYLGAAVIYLLYRQRRSVVLYALCLILFALSLLSKPAAVVLPLALLLFDLYLDGRLQRRVLLDKLPLLVGSIVIGVVTLRAQTAGGAVHVASFDPLERVLLAAQAFVTYAIGLVAPVGHSAFHPYPRGITGGHALALLAALAILALAVWAYRRAPVVFFGIGFLAVHLVLVLQLVPVGSAIVAERYTYVAYLGPFFVLGVGLDAALRRLGRSRRRVAALLAVATLLAAIGCTRIVRSRIAVWRDSLTLWSDVIERYPERAAKAYSARGVHYRRLGEPSRALADYDRAIEIDPTYAKTYLSRANLYRDRGLASDDPAYFHRSLEDLDVALSLRPDDPDAYNSRALAYYHLGEIDDALEAFEAALRLAPAHRDALTNRARLWRSSGRFERALEDYSTCVELWPDDPPLRLMRADTFLVVGRVEAALEDFDRCVETDPAFADCYVGRAHVLERMGRHAEAERDRRTAARLAE